MLVEPAGKQRQDEQRKENISLMLTHRKLSKFLTRVKGEEEEEEELRQRLQQLFARFSQRPPEARWRVSNDQSWQKKRTTSKWMNY